MNAANGYLRSTSPGNRHSAFPPELPVRSRNVKRTGGRRPLPGQLSESLAFRKADISPKTKIGRLGVSHRICFPSTVCLGRVDGIDRLRFIPSGQFFVSRKRKASRSCIRPAISHNGIHAGSGHRRLGLDHSKSMQVRRLVVSYDSLLL